MIRFYKYLVHPEENILRVSRELVQALHVPVTQYTLKQDLENHPDYPSMLSMSDVLAGRGVPNASVKLSVDQLPEFETPFVALIKDRKGNNQYDLVTSLDERFVQSSILGRSTWESFKKHYQDIVLLAEVGEHAGESDYAQKRKQEKFRKFTLDTALLFVPVLVILFSFYQLFAHGFTVILPTAYLILSLIGWIVGSLLLWYEIDSGNVALKEVCGGNKVQQKNCDAVLKSKGASIFGLSWSELGFSFFTALLLGQLIGGFATPSTFAVLFVLSVAAALYVPFSLIYQSRVAKQWCPLCLTVQGVLTLQLAISLLAGWYRHIPIVFAWGMMLTVAVLGLATLLLIRQLVPLVKSNRRLVAENTNLMKFKYNGRTFEQMLRQQKAIVPAALGGLGISIGNPDARHTVVKVCNPYCGPCARAHPLIDELIEDNKDVKVQIIFTASNDEQDTRTAPVRHLLAIAEKGNEQLTKQALDDWYNSEVKDYAYFAEKYPMNGELAAQHEKIDAMHQWCRQTDIQYTPTFFVNGYQLPDHYRLKDLHYLLKFSG